MWERKREKLSYLLAHRAKRGEGRKRGGKGPCFMPAKHERRKRGKKNSRSVPFLGVPSLKGGKREREERGDHNIFLLHFGRGRKGEGKKSPPQASCVNLKEKRKGERERGEGRFDCLRSITRRGKRKKEKERSLTGRALPGPLGGMGENKKERGLPLSAEEKREWKGGKKTWSETRDSLIFSHPPRKKRGGEGREKREKEKKE